MYEQVSSNQGGHSQDGLAIQQPEHAEQVTCKNSDAAPHCSLDSSLSAKPVQFSGRTHVLSKEGWRESRSIDSYRSEHMRAVQRPLNICDASARLSFSVSCPATAATEC